VASYAAFQNPKLLQNWILIPNRTAKGKNVWTVLTSGFIHADYNHLIFNCISLYFFSSSLESYYSHSGLSPLAGVLGIFLLGVLAGSLSSLRENASNPNYQTLGASGGVAAVVFASIYLNPTSDICLYFVLCIPGYFAGFLFLAYSYYSARNSQGLVNHSAHLAGALVGLACQIFVSPNMISSWKSLWPL